MTNNLHYCWDAYDPWVFDCGWWADIISRLDFREDLERLGLFRRAQSLLPSRFSYVRWHVSATGL